jgi:diguanylate cyclase (GGDEF)-like protein/putative nucleotidyltransferase with HDIG domain
VAGPFREINNALQYDYELYPSRFVEVGYVDASGRERARVLRGRRTPAAALLDDVRGWPSFAQGVRTPVGTARATLPFVSPTARVPVVATTTTVSVGGRVRAYVELELALRALQSVLSSDIARGTDVEIVDRNGTRLTGVGRPFPVSRGQLRYGLRTEGRRRVAIHSIGQSALAEGPWFVASAARAPSAISMALDPDQGAILALSLLFFLAAFVGFRRARRAAAVELAAEQRARTEAERLSRIDVLTGLHNRRHVLETIEHELARTGRQGSAVGVLMLDVDLFKRINDAHGHAAGDAVLVEIARRLRVGVRSWDVVARVGGEEFCIIAPEVSDEAEVAELGDRLRAAVAERAMPIRPGVALPVTISVGIALLHDGDGSAERVFDCADRALYAAKRRGRNRLCRFSRLDDGDLRAEELECLHLAEALAVAGDLRDGEAASHSRAVADLAAAVAERLGLDEDHVLKVRLGGWLHDVGKIAMPDGILSKPGRLTAAEWEIVRTHAGVGAGLVSAFPELALAAGAVRHHHERWDGGGYPDGLSGEQIPLEARIVCAVDAFCAMLAERSYQPARTTPAAVAELERCASQQFDPRVVAALVGVVESQAVVAASL